MSKRRENIDKLYRLKSLADLGAELFNLSDQSIDAIRMAFEILEANVGLVVSYEPKRDEREKDVEGTV